MNSVNLLYGDLAPVIRESIKQVINEYKVKEKSNEVKTTYIVSELEDNKEIVVFGLTEKNALELDGDPNGNACESNHNHDDYSNRWCHAFFDKLVSEVAKKHGIPNVVASLMGASIFIVKEYAIDQNPSMPDLVVTDFEIYKTEKNSKSLNATVFGDGMVFITYKRSF